MKKSGDLGQFLIPAAAACVVLANRDVRGVSSYATAFGTTMGVAYLIKPTVRTQRPNGGSMSFPSGHTAAAMGGAAFLHMRYGWLYGLPAYIAATYVGFSRVYAYKHWARDVVGATAIAMAANAFFTVPFKNKNYVFIPHVEPDRAGIAVRWRW